MFTSDRINYRIKLTRGLAGVVNKELSFSNTASTTIFSILV